MSHNASDGSAPGSLVRRGDGRKSDGLERELEALRSGSDHDDIGDSHGSHDSTDHIASLYEGRSERLAAVVPFLRQGLERGERCVYVTDEATREDALEVLRSAGVDADAALESGALWVPTIDDVYLRNGTFDVDEALDAYADTIEESAAEYEGVRVAADADLILDAAADVEAFLEYESRVNELLSDEDCIALCQYDRDRVAPDVLCDVVRTHPHLVSDGAVCHNVYYTPPDEFLAPDRPAQELDRMVDTVEDRTEFKTELQDRQRYLQRQNEITADPDRSFEGKLQALFELGCDRFDLELGAMARVDVEDDRFEVEYVSDDHEHFEPGVELPLSETYCTAATEIKDAGSVSEPRKSGYDDITVYQEFGIRAYLGTYIAVDGGPDRTFFFVTSESRTDGFTDDEHTFQRLLGQWVKYELQHRRRNDDQRALYEIAADTTQSFDEKLQALFELGCDRFDLELGAMASIDPADDLFEVEAVSDEHEQLRPGARFPLSETYCRVHDSCGESKAVTNPVDDGFEGTAAHDEIGVSTYLGTRIELDDERDRTLFFVSTDPHEEFTESEQTFHHLIGQWVEYELKQQVQQRTLEETVEELEHVNERLETSNERLEQFAYAASHDLQEPLRMVSSYLQLIETRYGDELDADGREFFEFAVDGADRMKKMIEGLLDYSRVETQGNPFEPVKLDSVIGEVLTDLQLQIEESDADITVEELPRVRGDCGQLRQLFQNLVQNALEYSGERPPTIRISAERDGQNWVVSVRDEGIGIDPDSTDRIFKVFQRLHSREEYDGTGLGLALCKRIVERHEGEIWVDSTPGEGSTFFVSIPDTQT